MRKETLGNRIVDTNKSLGKQKSKRNVSPPNGIKLLLKVVETKNRRENNTIPMNNDSLLSPSIKLSPPQVVFFIINII